MLTNRGTPYLCILGIVSFHKDIVLSIEAGNEDLFDAIFVFNELSIDKIHFTLYQKNIE